MNCNDSLLLSMDTAAAENRFPIWTYNEDYSFTGAMRASGFIASTGLALVFETVEYSVREGVIQPEAYCISTFPTKTWRHFGDSVYVPNESMMHPETGQVILKFGDKIKVSSRESIFDITLEKNKTILANPNNLNPKQQIILSLLFKICDTIPHNYLFSKWEHLHQMFGMPKDAKQIFLLDNWEHPSGKIYKEKGVKPSSYPDMAAMANALCSGNIPPQLSANPNTSWQKQWLLYIN